MTRDDPDRRRFLGWALGAAATLPAMHATAAKGGFRSDPWPGCNLDLSRAQFRSAADWNRVYEKFWGPIGRQSDAQMHAVVHAVDGVYDDSDGPFAWIVHYWIRAWVTMADLTGDTRYMDMCVSFIDYMLDNTDERRIERGEKTEAYIRDPLYLRGTGKGGPFWSRQDNASVLDTGQVARGIMAFVDAVFEKPDRWAGYGPTAFRFFEAAIMAADAFENDWQTQGSIGAYHYRDSDGSGALGTTRTAFNQSATMVATHLAIHKWRPDPNRVDKVRRLAQYWIDHYAVRQPDGAITWRYILIEGDRALEDAGHATTDLEFLIPAYLSGLTSLNLAHMNGLSKTFLRRLHDGRHGLKEFVDGSGRADYAEQFNAGFGWFQLARFAPEIAEAALRIYNEHYPLDAPGGILWSRPMLGWANLLSAGRTCRP